jgi:nucleoside triphosphate pyrophosphatase
MSLLARSMCVEGIILAREEQRDLAGGAFTHTHRRKDRRRYSKVVLVLASQSPRRAEILRLAGIPFTVRVVAIDETPRPGEAPEQYVCRLAEEKAMAVDAVATETVLAADTTVVSDGEMLAKPANAADARRMLETLSGRVHQVLTGICLRRSAQRRSDYASTRVWFNKMTSDEIASYVASGEPMDKAGGYAIQGLAAKYIEKIDGCYFNVVGLPIALVYRHLKDLTATGFHS